jgi:polyisoprenoid-binding protein YceI
MKIWQRWLVAGVAAAAIGATAGPFIYIHFIQGKAPAPLTVATKTPASTGTATAASGSVDGAWSISSGSIVGYRVKEVLFGQSNEAVGRTSSITGSITIDGATVRSASFTVDMTTVASDEDRRDHQFQGRIMDTASFPTATFKLTQPIELGSLPGEGVTSTATAVGDLTLHGTTKPVTVKLTGNRTGGTIQVSGAIHIVFADWGIPNPTFGPVSTEDNGSLEFLLKLTHA